MNKWEYGFLTYKLVITKTTGILKGAEGYRIALLNGVRIEDIVADYKGGDFEGNTKEMQQLQQLAFNKLGSMGWELATISEYATISNTSSSLASQSHETIVFKRLIE